MPHKKRYEKTRWRIIRKIKDLYRHGEPLNIHAVKRLHPELISKVYSVQPFWGWAQAIRLAGLDYKQIRIQLLETVTCQICGKELGHRDFSTQEKVIRALKVRLKAGKSLVSYHLKDDDRYLHKKVQEYFANYYDCYAFVGLDPSEVCGQRRYASTDAVIAAMKRRCDMGRGLRVVDLVFGPKRDRDTALFNSAIHFFGKWSTALNFASIDPEKKRPKGSPSASTIMKRRLERLRKKR